MIVNVRIIGLVLLCALLLPCAALSQKKSPSHNKKSTLEAQVKALSEKVNVLEARIAVLELLRGQRSTEELRQGSIQASKDAILNDVNALAANAYQYRIRPTTMGGGGGSYIGYVLPRRLANNGNASYSISVVADSLIEFNATSKFKYGTVKATLNAEGRLNSFVYTGEFQ
jgi:hypothetical protein